MKNGHYIATQIFTGPPLPEAMALATTVSFGNSFLVVGGYNYNYLNTIYKFNPGKGVKIFYVARTDSKQMQLQTQD